MTYTFAADRRVIFVVQCGGRNRLVEFGERNENGVSAFSTTDAAVAAAIRKSSLSRRGAITDTTKYPEPGTQAPMKKEEKKKQAQEAGTASAPEVREFDNFTLAREAITKEFGLKKSEVRNPTALARVAQEHGFTIKYLNAEK